MTLSELEDAVRRRLGDLTAVIWTATEVIGHLQGAYEDLATALPIFWDWTYLESLPSGFSVTARWERRLLGGAAIFDYGMVANFTAEFERRMLGDERLRLGPANHTSPFEATDGLLARAHASTAIAATAELPASLTALARVTWDRRGLDALDARRTSQLDSRYELTAGEVFGFIWQKDGVRTLRKVRVPAAQGDTVTVTGSWGALRDPTDLHPYPRTGTLTAPTPFSVTAAWETPLALQAGLRVPLGLANYTALWEAPLLTPLARIGPAWYTAAWEVAYLARLGLETPVTACWGVPRRIPGHHPIGTESFGAPRRPFLDGKNLRVEHHRQGRPLDAGDAVCELPDRYAIYLRDYAQAQCLARPGPGQDLKLAAHFQQRWERGLARCTRRLQVVDAEHVTVFGGEGRPSVNRPPRPKLPWQYGSVVR